MPFDKAHVLPEPLDLIGNQPPAFTSSSLEQPEMQMSAAAPLWLNNNLAHHHAKRLRENPGCFEDLLGVSGRSITAAEFEHRSVQAVADSWLEYEAQSRDFASSSYRSAGMHYVDNDLVVAITDQTRSKFVTCFHEHFDSRRPLHGRHPGRGVSVAQRRLRYKEDLVRKEKGRVIINLRILRDA
jgi:hypothetical protein